MPVAGGCLRAGLSIILPLVVIYSGEKRKQITGE